jgi:hypothetical protein
MNEEKRYEDPEQGKIYEKCDSCGEFVELCDLTHTLEDDMCPICGDPFDTVDLGFFLGEL